VAPVKVEVGAFPAGRESRPRDIESLGVTQDLDAPIRCVADDLAAARRDELRPVHPAIVNRLGVLATQVRPRAYSESIERRAT
jgi:hypothetical protein